MLTLQYKTSFAFYVTAPATLVQASKGFQTGGSNHTLGHWGGLLGEQRRDLALLGLGCIARLGVEVR